MKQESQPVSPRRLARWMQKLHAQSEKLELPKNMEDMLIATFVAGYETSTRDSMDAVRQSNNAEEVIGKLAQMQVDSMEALISQVDGPEALIKAQEADVEADIEFVVPHNGSVN